MMAARHKLTGLLFVGALPNTSKVTVRLHWVAGTPSALDAAPE